MRRTKSENGGDASFLNARSESRRGGSGSGRDGGVVVTRRERDRNSEVEFYGTTIGLVTSEAVVYCKTC